MLGEGVKMWTRQDILGLGAEGVENLAASGVNQLGIESGVEQELKGPITTAEKLLEETSDSHVLLVYYKDDKPLGFIKYGEKNLFFYTKKGVVKELLCTCVLDFYVSTVLQRSGLGSVLFKDMLTRLQLHPNTLAYDRPSPKLVSFLKKHYGLINSDLQPNRYAIFPQEFMGGVLAD